MGTEETIDATPMGSEGAELLKSGSALVKLENHTQMVMALQRPRDEAKVLKAATDELAIYKEAAEEAIYSKPVGRRDGQMQFAEGLSIRAAEALALRWGNNAFGAEILEDDGEVLSGVAVWLDYETNNRRTFPFKVSRKFKGKNGVMKRHPEDRFYDVVVPAKLSRILRETILRSLPAGLKKAYEREARRIMSKKGAGNASGVVKGFALMGVAQMDLESLIGKPMAGWSESDIAQLVGIGNAIKQGETTVEQTFGLRGGESDRSGSIERVLETAPEPSVGGGTKTTNTKPPISPPDPTPEEDIPEVTPDEGPEGGAGSAFREARPTADSMRLDIANWLGEMNGGNADLAAQELFMYSGKEDGSGEIAGGVSSVTDLKGNQLQTTWRRVRNAHAKRKGD